MKSVIFQEEMPHDFSQNTDFPAAYRGKDHLEKPRDGRSPGGGRGVTGTGGRDGIAGRGHARFMETLIINEL